MGRWDAGRWDEKYSSGLENYGFDASMLRFVEIGRFCAENRPKSRGKIWKRAENVVPLHCDHKREDGDP